MAKQNKCAFINDHNNESLLYVSHNARYNISVGTCF